MKPLTKPHFELIASAVYAVYRDASATGDTEGRAYVLYVASNLADALATTNPRFQRDTFLRACGVAS